MDTAYVSAHLAWHTQTKMCLQALDGVLEAKEGHDWEVKARDLCRELNLLQRIHARISDRQHLSVRLKLQESIRSAVVKMCRISRIQNREFVSAFRQTLPQELRDRVYSYVRVAIPPPENTAALESAYNLVSYSAISDHTVRPITDSAPVRKSSPPLYRNYLLRPEYFTKDVVKEIFTNYLQNTTFHIDTFRNGIPSWFLSGDRFKLGAVPHDHITSIIWELPSPIEMLSARLGELDILFTLKKKTSRIQFVITCLKNENTEAVQRKVLMFPEIAAGALLKLKSAGFRVEFWRNVVAYGRLESVWHDYKPGFDMIPLNLEAYGGVVEHRDGIQKGLEQL